MKVNPKRNAEYYSSPSVQPCDCNVCKNFYMQIKEKCPKAAEYLMSINVDILKPFELVWVERENNMIDYISCQYIVFGSCEEEFKMDIDGITFENNLYFHPGTGIDEEKDAHFVLDFGKILMEMKL